MKTGWNRIIEEMHWNGLYPEQGYLYEINLWSKKTDDVIKILCFVDPEDEEVINFLSDYNDIENFEDFSFGECTKIYRVATNVEPIEEEE